MTVFNELLAIKRYREQQAEIALQSQRRLLEAIQQKQEQAARALSDYQRYAQETEAALYNDLYKQSVRISAINHVLACVRTMQAHEAALHQDLQAIQNDLNDAQARFADALNQHRKTSRATEKFIELAQIHHDAALQEDERQEDMEMEEVASIRRDQDEWTHHEEVEIA